MCATSDYEQNCKTLAISMNECSGPIHFNQQFAHTVQTWSGTDSAHNFKLNCADLTRKAKLKQLGWLDSGFDYRFNNEGFRDENFDQRPCAIALGCSHTQGVGLPEGKTWPKQLESLLGIKVWNLGVGGAALDTCFRLLEFWIQHLTAKYVFCAVPDLARYEVFSNGNWSSILPRTEVEPWLSGWQKNYLSWEQNSQINRTKTLLAMQQICDQHSVEFHCDFLTDFTDGGDARDLMHCGADSNSKLAKKFYSILEI
jgi:hypothetical protein